jgi:hypothetical protein
MEVVEPYRYRVAFHWDSLEIPQIPSRFPRDSLEIPSRFLRDSFEIPSRFPRDSLEIPFRFPRDSLEIPSRFPDNLLYVVWTLCDLLIEYMKNCIPWGTSQFGDASIHACWRSARRVVDLNEIHNFHSKVVGIIHIDNSELKLSISFISTTHWCAAQSCCFEWDRRVWTKVIDLNETYNFLVPDPSL